MEIKTFKKIFGDQILLNGGRKVGSYYRFENAEILMIVGLQKSNYQQAYYINIGYVLKPLHQVTSDLRYVDGDLRSRFCFYGDRESTELFDMESIDEEGLKRSLQQNIDKLVKPADSLDGLKRMIESHPVMLYQTTVQAKVFLGYQ